MPSLEKHFTIIGIPAKISDLLSIRKDGCFMSSFINASFTAIDHVKSKWPKSCCVIKAPEQSRTWSK